MPMTVLPRRTQPNIRSTVTVTEKTVIKQSVSFPDGKHRIVVHGEWTVDYINVRRGVTDIVLSPRDSAAPPTSAA